MTDSNRAHSTPGSPSTSSTAHRRRNREHHVVFLNNVAPEPVQWLSPGRIAAGKITLLDGDPGLGKSSLLCEFAARVTRGEPLPGGAPHAPRSVILMSAEDDLYDTIRPRIDAAGGDPGLILAFANLPPLAAVKAFAIPDNIPILEELIQRIPTALLLIDPLFAFLSGRHHANSEQGVRRALLALRGLAERTGVAIVAVRHLNKSGASNPLYRGGGSIGIIGSARCGLLLAADPEDPQRRILASTKGNLGPLPASLAFRLDPAPGTNVARVVWEGERPWTAAELLQESALGPESRSARAAAREWLRAALEAGPRSAKSLLREAAEAGFGRDTIYAARKAEGIRLYKERVPGGAWVWSSTADASELPSKPESPELQEVQEVQEV